MTVIDPRIWYPNGGQSPINLDEVLCWAPYDTTSVRITVITAPGGDDDQGSPALGPTVLNYTDGLEDFEYFYQVYQDYLQDPSTLCDRWDFVGTYDCDLETWSVEPGTQVQWRLCDSDTAWELSGACTATKSMYVPHGDPEPDPGAVDIEPDKYCCNTPGDCDRYVWVSTYDCDLTSWGDPVATVVTEVSCDDDTTWALDGDCIATRTQYVPTGDPEPDPGAVDVSPDPGCCP